MVFGPGNGYRLRTIKAHYTVNAPFSEDYPEDAYSIILCWGPCCPWTLGGCNRSEAVVAGSENWTTSRPVVPDNLDDSSCGLVSYNPNGGRVTANVSQHVCLSPCFMCSKKKVKVKNGVWWRSKDRRIISNHRGKKGFSQWVKFLRFLRIRFPS